MNSRKIIRNAMRRFGSKFLASEWDAYQIKKVGVKTRRRNQAKGPTPKRRWRNRIEATLPA